MKYPRTFLMLILFIGITSWLTACSGGGGGGNGNGNSSAKDFSDSFENTNVTTIATFDLSDNGITATVAGGTAFTIGNGLLYHSGVKSWMVEPAGVNSSTGIGTITFSVPMSRICFWVRRDPGNISMVTILDVDGNHAENSPITSLVANDWTEVDWTITTGSPALRSILLEVTGGVGMAALDDLGGNSE